MVARGSLTSSLSQLLQNHLNNPHQSFSTGQNNNMSRVANVSPTITVRGDDGSSTYPPGLTVSGQNSTIVLENVDATTTFNGNVKNGIISDSVSCASEMWPWESHVPTISK